MIQSSGSIQHHIAPTIDVYKRQVGDFEAIWLLTKNGDFRLRGYNPVSYTHLDVYKRQVLDGSNGYFFDIFYRQIDVGPVFAIIKVTVKVAVYKRQISG